MPQQIVSLQIDDISYFTKSLRNALLRTEELPGHAAMLGLVAKAAGFENFQHLKANKAPIKRNQPDKQLSRAIRAFEQGIMTRWPKQTAVQGLCLWVFWAKLPARMDMTEAEANTILKAGHSFGDHALLRRSLIDHRLVQRTKDGSIYRRVEQAPPPQAAALIREV